MERSDLALSMIQAFGDGTCRKHQKIAGNVI